MYQSQAGEFVKADVFSGNDTITGDLRELDADTVVYERDGRQTLRPASTMKLITKS